jgi:hypothetical protein
MRTKSGCPSKTTTEPTKGVFMSRRTLVFVMLGTLCIFCMVIMGCTTGPSSSVSSELTDVNDIDTYFPVVEGYRTTYEVTSGNTTTETITFEVGPEVQFGLSRAHKWLITDDSGDTELSYLLVRDNAVYYYANVRTIPEKILSLPLSPGSTWERFTPTTVTDTAAEITNTEYNSLYDKFGGDKTYTGMDVPFQKTFPSAGANEVSVDAVEDIGLQSGVTYSGAIRLKIAGPVGKYNYYWFAPDIGLTRYVIGASEDNYTDGDVVGELIDYGF